MAIRAVRFGREQAITVMESGRTVVGFAHSTPRYYYRSANNIVVLSPRGMSGRYEFRKENLPEAEYVTAFDYMEELNQENVKTIQGLRQELHNVASERDAFKKAAVEGQIRQVKELQAERQGLRAGKEIDRVKIKDLQDRNMDLLRRALMAGKVSLTKEETLAVRQLGLPQWLNDKLGVPAFSDEELLAALTDRAVPREWIAEQIRLRGEK